MWSRELLAFLCASEGLGVLLCSCKLLNHKEPESNWKLDRHLGFKFGDFLLFLIPREQELCAESIRASPGQTGRLVNEGPASTAWIMAVNWKWLGSLFPSRSWMDTPQCLCLYLFLTNKDELSCMPLLFQRWSCEGLHCRSLHSEKGSIYLHQTSICCSTSFEKCLVFHLHLAWVLCA